MADTKISALTAATTPLAGTEVLPIVQGGVTKQVSVANLTAGRAISASKVGVGTSTFDATYQPILQVESSAADGTGGLLIGSYLPTLTLYDYSGGAGASQIQQDGTDFLVKNGGATRFKIGSTGDATLSSGNLIQGTAAKGINFTANTGAAGKTSQLLNWYEEGTWTPTDASGGSLTFTGTSGNCYYTRTGNLVTCVFSVTYPTTLDTNSARISGLPFTSKSSTNAIAGGQLSFTNYGSFLSIAIDTGGTAFYFWNSSGSLVTNATCSGKTFRAVIQYMV